jgi:hypothetical protein
MIIIDEKEFLRYAGILACPENFPDDVSIGIFTFISHESDFQPGFKYCIADFCVHS